MNEIIILAITIFLLLIAEIALIIVAIKMRSIVKRLDLLYKRLAKRGE